MLQVGKYTGCQQISFVALFQMEVWDFGIFMTSI
ncbi:hypothetical protein LINPERHAP2_LOCUS9167 [Linum perenne]